MKAILFTASIILCQLISNSIYAQDVIDESSSLSVTNTPKYKIGGVKITGAVHSDKNALLSITGLQVEDIIQVPGTKITSALKSLWKLRLFDDVQIVKEKMIDNVIFLEIIVKESARYNSHSFIGIKKSKHDDLNTLVKKHLSKGNILTENDKNNTQLSIKNYFIAKGYHDVEVDIIEKQDDENSIQLIFVVDKKKRVRIQDITFTGNTLVSDRKLRKLLSETHRKRKIFSSSKFIENNFEVDKQQIIQYYHNLGYRDTKITSDSLWRADNGDLMIHLNIEEKKAYYLGNISWKGNSLYSAAQLSQILAIKKGDIYNEGLLQSRLHFSEDGQDISTLYMDDGYLFFNIEGIETAIIEDTIDIEIRIFEGKQATIGKVTIKGNSRTNEHVIRRELRTKPGHKFSRSDIIRSQRELINMGYFDPEKLAIQTPVDPKNGTVDIEYTVEEKSADQLELSASWGGVDAGLIGTLGVSFNNFSLKNILNKEAWNPYPQGDGQKLSLRVQSNGKKYQSYNFSFTEPWLGGKKPKALSFSGYYNRYTQLTESGDLGIFSVIGASTSLSTRLNFPDDNFISSTALNLKKYTLGNWTNGLFQTDNGEMVTEGNYYNLSISQTIARNTINNPIFPTEGSKVSLSGQFTLPYSLFNDKSGQDLPPNEQFKFLEYHKWKFDAVWYTTLFGKLVLKAQAKFGFVGRYNKEMSISPFERFQIGGDGMSAQNYSSPGTDNISLRGYEREDLENNFMNGGLSATPLYDKFTLELRYPFSLNPNATFYGLVFAEGGNSWKNLKDFQPFDLKRSIGVGFRAHLPMFGLIGFDYGVGFDKTGDSTLKNYGKISVILGFEPD